MKHNIFNLGIFFIGILLLGACDHVKNVKDPYAISVTGNRKVLLEDYTGHKCGNCPAAADTLSYIEKKYPGKIIPLAIHAGFFATVNGNYPTDFRTSIGDAYDTQFGVSAAGNPNGLVNRVGFGSGGFIKAYTTWEGEVAAMLNKSAKFEMKIRNVYTASNNNLNTQVVVKSLTNTTGLYKLVVLLSEDSIISKQLDYRLPAGNQVISNYEFKHVLRAAINSAWGDPVFTGGAVVNDSVVKSFPNYTISSNYRSKKCHVIAYIYDADPSSPTYYEVLQAEEAHVE